MEGEKIIINEELLTYKGGENLNLQDVLIKNRHSHFYEKVKYSSCFLSNTEIMGENLYRRIINSPSDTEVEVFDRFEQKSRIMLMFGSNNYLGLANHPMMIEKVVKSINKYGVGIGGPPLLNGHTLLHQELEERLAALKKKEAAMIFSSGYNTNVGLMIGLCPDNNDVLLYDEYSHASLHDGMKASRIKALQFRHNDMVHLEELLKKQERSRSIFICVEGIYSMDGDMTPLPKVVALAKKYNAIVLLDDAHASLVIGENGAGTSSVFDLEKDIDIIMGTFSKAFAVTGGFLAASEEIIEHMRFFSRSYMFSASLPIPVVASVLAALDINEEHPELRKQLFNNIEYAKSKLQQFDMVCEPEGAIIALRVPTTINIRKAARMFHDRGVFINSIEYPAVPRSEQRFRISLMATHKKEQIDKLAEVVEEVWSKTVEIA